jgi:hypothetical protein
MATAPHLPERRSQFWSAPRERIYIQIIHWSVIVIVATFTFVLAMSNDLDRASVTAIFGTIVGHVGTAAVNKAASRSSDHPARSDGPESS